MQNMRHEKTLATCQYEESALKLRFNCSTSSIKINISSDTRSEPLTLYGSIYLNQHIQQK